MNKLFFKLKYLHNSIIFCLLFLNIAFSQSDLDNIIKYWHYRNRLKYFVIPGIKQGESHVFDIRNKDLSSEATVAQQNIYFGYYLGTLAIEYKLLCDNGKYNQAQKTLQEIQYALIQHIRYKDSCSSEYPGDIGFDGFFIRENMPCNFLDENSEYGYTTDSVSHYKLLNESLTPENTWDEINKTFKNLPRGHPGYINCIVSNQCPPNNAIPKTPMSQDEVYGLLVGLMLVAKFCPDNVSNVAKEIIYQTISYIRNQHGNVFLPDNYYRIKLPNDGFLTNEQGGDCRTYASALEKILYNYNYDNYYLILPQILETIWQVQKYFPLSDENHSNNIMAAKLAAMSKNWFIRIPIRIGCCGSFCPSGLCLTKYIKIPATGWGIKNITKKHNQETFYLLLYEILHNKKTSYLDQTKAKIQLNSAPCDGPYFYGGDIHPESDIYGGWSSSYRWQHIKNIQQNGDTAFMGVYNGLDYMLFYNLYHLRFGGPLYENYNNRYLSGTLSYPSIMIAFDTLYSNQIINNTEPTTRYIAGKQIVLKPGFHAVYGSNFHAYIKETECGDLYLEEESSESEYPLEEDTLIFTDTIPCLDPEHDTLYLNGIWEDSTCSLFSYLWNLGPGVTYIPSQNVPNPAVIFPTCDRLYRCSLTLIDSTGDSIVIDFNIYKECCNTSKAKIYRNLYNTYFETNSYIYLYPNPAYDKLYVFFLDMSIKVKNVEIKNITGKKLDVLKVYNDKQYIDISELRSGIYIMEITDENNLIYRKKFIKK